MKQRKFNVHTHVLFYFLSVYHMNNETKKFKTHTHTHPTIRTKATNYLKKQRRKEVLTSQK